MGIPRPLEASFAGSVGSRSIDRVHERPQLPLLEKTMYQVQEPMDFTQRSNSAGIPARAVVHEPQKADMLNPSWGACGVDSWLRRGGSCKTLHVESAGHWPCEVRRSRSVFDLNNTNVAPESYPCHARAHRHDTRQKPLLPFAGSHDSANLDSRTDLLRAEHGAIEAVSSAALAMEARLSESERPHTVRDAYDSMQKAEHRMRKKFSTRQETGPWTSRPHMEMPDAASKQDYDVMAMNTYRRNTYDACLRILQAETRRVSEKLVVSEMQVRDLMNERDAELATLTARADSLQERDQLSQCDRREFQRSSLEEGDLVAGSLDPLRQELDKARREAVSLTEVSRESVAAIEAQAQHTLESIEEERARLTVDHVNAMNRLESAEEDCQRMKTDNVRMQTTNQDLQLSVDGLTGKLERERERTSQLFAELGTLKVDFELRVSRQAAESDDRASALGRRLSDVEAERDRLDWEVSNLKVGDDQREQMLVTLQQRLDEQRIRAEVATSELETLRRSFDGGGDAINPHREPENVEREREQLSSDGVEPNMAEEVPLEDKDGVLEQKLEILQVALDEERECHAVTSAELQGAREEVVQVQRTIAALYADNVLLVEGGKKHEQEVANLQQSLDQELEKLMIMKNDLEIVRGERDAEISQGDELRTRIKVLERHGSKVQQEADLEAHKTELEGLLAMIEKLRSEKDAAEEMSESLTLQLSEMKAADLERDEKAADLQTRLRAGQTAIHSLQLEVETMRSGEQTQLVSLQAEIERMTSELSDLKAERDVAVAQRRMEFESEVIDLQDQLERSTSHRDTLGADLALIMETSQQLKEELKRVAAERDVALESLDAKSKDIERLTAELASANEQSTRNQSDTILLHREIQKLKDELASVHKHSPSETDISQFNEQLLSLKAERNNLKTVNEMLRGLHSSKSKSHEDKTKEMERLNVERDVAVQLDMLKAELASARKSPRTHVDLSSIAEPGSKTPASVGNLAPPHTSSRSRRGSANMSSCGSSSSQKQVITFDLSSARKSLSERPKIDSLDERPTIDLARHSIHERPRIDSLDERPTIDLARHSIHERPKFESLVETPALDSPRRSMHEPPKLGTGGLEVVDLTSSLMDSDRSSTSSNGGGASSMSSSVPGFPRSDEALQHVEQTPAESRSRARSSEGRASRRRRQAWQQRHTQGLFTSRVGNSVTSSFDG